MRTRQPMIERQVTLLPASNLVDREIERTGASALDLRTAAAFLASGAGPRAYQALTARMRRLVDLMTVATIQGPGSDAGRDAA